MIRNGILAGIVALVASIFLTTTANAATTPRPDFAAIAADSVSTSSATPALTCAGMGNGTVTGIDFQAGACSYGSTGGKVTFSDQYATMRVESKGSLPAVGYWASNGAEPLGAAGAHVVVSCRDVDLHHGSVSLQLVMSGNGNIYPMSSVTVTSKGGSFPLIGSVPWWDATNVWWQVLVSANGGARAKCTLSSVDYNVITPF